ncbi:MAG: hypothetical protein QXL95_04515 [Thermoplasmata archaeon]
MIVKDPLKELASMLGYSKTHCLVIEKILENNTPVDVYYIQEKIGMSRSLVSKVLRDLWENGILDRIRYNHRLLYRLNENFLTYMYDSFMKNIKKNIDEINYRYGEKMKEQVEKIRKHLIKYWEE